MSLRDYELVVVLNPTLPREAAEASWQRIKGLVVERGGSVSQEEQWGTRRLAYPIRKVGQTFTEGAYVLGRFKMDAAQARRLEESLRLMEEVLRFLLVKVEGTPGTPPPSLSKEGEGEAEAAPSPSQR